MTYKKIRMRLFLYFDTIEYFIVIMEQNSVEREKMWKGST